MCSFLIMIAIVLSEQSTELAGLWYKTFAGNWSLKKTCLHWWIYATNIATDMLLTLLLTCYWHCYWHATDIVMLLSTLQWSRGYLKLRNNTFILTSGSIKLIVGKSMYDFSASCLFGERSDHLSLEAYVYRWHWLYDQFWWLNLTSILSLNLDCCVYALFSPLPLLAYSEMKW